MAGKKYNKTPTTYSEQIALLKKRGLNIPDEARAIRYLQQISYYRLSAYFIPYQEKKDEFNAGVGFDQILETYKFDRELRLLVFDCIERIEIAIRAQLIYVLAHNHNSSHWQDIPSVFKPAYTDRQGKEIDAFNETQKIISTNCASKNPEVFIQHYLDNYSSPKNPPSWMFIELLTIGELSRLYKGLNQNKDKQDISDFFGLHHTVFASWLHTLSYVRNICAHHARLWNREFAIKPDILLKPRKQWVISPFNNNQRTFYFLCTLKYLLWGANPNNHLSAKLDHLFLKYSGVPIQFLGIPTGKNSLMLDWKEQDLWKKDE
jgi:abortive infection bacteriophage resistance protein